MTRNFIALSLATTVLISACGETARLSVAEGSGPQPRLPPPRPALVPTLNIAPASPWPTGEAPTPAAGLTVVAFARGLDHPRWLQVLPNGDVLVAETNAPPKPEDGKGIKGFFMGLAMKKAGADTPSANRISLLRDADHDGVAERRSVFLANLNSPFGMTLVGQTLYVADTDAIVRVTYVADSLSAASAPTHVIGLPAGPINHHWTKNVIASPDGARLYATVGSNSNVGERGLAAEEGRAAIWEIDPATGAHRIFASGLRNPNGMDWEPLTGALWTAVNERDEIGSDLVPDYLTSVRAGGFYGWPFSYFGTHPDRRVKPQDPARVASAIVPDYALGPHTASLGLAFAKGAASLPPEYRSGAFVGQHGSWNRRPWSGYKVIFVPFAQGRPAGPPRDVLTGFLSADGKARGRPVGVVIAKDGALLVADDVGGVIWRVTGD